MDTGVAMSSLLLVSLSESPGSQAGAWQGGVLMAYGLQAVAAHFMHHLVLTAVTKTWLCGV